MKKMYKRQSYGTALWWIHGRTLTLKRYLATYYPIYDWGLIERFFIQNPIQARVILDDFIKDNDTKTNQVADLIIGGKSKITYIIGARGSGKTCFAGWLLDKIHEKDEYQKIFVVGEDIIQDFPSWIQYVDKIQDVPNGSIILLDEASIRYSAREFWREANIILGKYLAIARHKEISVIFITQHGALVDVNVTRLRDCIVWKKSNDYTLSERGGSSRGNREQRFWNKVRYNMAPRQQNEALFEYPAMKRFIHFKHGPPEWWNEKLSKLFKDFKFQERDKTKDNYTKDSVQVVKRKNKITSIKV